MGRSIALSGLKQVANQLGVRFKFFGTGFPMWSKGVYVILSLSEATQQPRFKLGVCLGSLSLGVAVQSS
jgi:hypothetical protein